MSTNSLTRFRKLEKWSYKKIIVLFFVIIYTAFHLETIDIYYVIEFKFWFSILYNLSCMYYTKKLQSKNEGF